MYRPDREDCSCAMNFFHAIAPIYACGQIDIELKRSVVGENFGCPSFVVGRGWPKAG